MASSRKRWPGERPRLAARVGDLVSLGDANGVRLSALPHSARADAGQRILTLYFRQLYGDAPTALDLRAQAWAVRDSNLHWGPAAILIEWDPEFLDALRGVYRGFYDHDDRAFIANLARLGLDGAADLFRAHIGSDDPRAVVFDRSTFVSSFGRIFEHCKREGIRLHPDFVLLGAYLGGLYDSLAELESPLDVTSAFRQGTAGAESAA